MNYAIVKRDPVAFLDETHGWPLPLKGAYSTVIDLLSKWGGKYPDNPKIIAAACGCGVRTWNKLKAKLIAMGKLTVEDGLIVNPVIRLAAQARRKVSAVRASVGAIGGAKPRFKRRVLSNINNLTEAKASTKDAMENEDWLPSMYDDADQVPAGLLPAKSEKVLLTSNKNNDLTEAKASANTQAGAGVAVSEMARDEEKHRDIDQMCERNIDNRVENDENRCPALPRTRGFWGEGCTGEGVQEEREDSLSFLRKEEKENSTSNESTLPHQGGTNYSTSAARARVNRRNEPPQPALGDDWTKHPGLCRGNVWFNDKTGRSHPLLKPRYEDEMLLEGVAFSCAEAIGFYTGREYHAPVSGLAAKFRADWFTIRDWMEVDGIRLDTILEALKWLASKPEFDRDKCVFAKCEGAVKHFHKKADLARREKEWEQCRLFMTREQFGLPPR